LTFLIVKTGLMKSTPFSSIILVCVIYHRSLIVYPNPPFSSDLKPYGFFYLPKLETLCTRSSVGKILDVLEQTNVNVLKTILKKLRWSLIYVHTKTQWRKGFLTNRLPVAMTTLVFVIIHLLSFIFWIRKILCKKRPSKSYRDSQNMPKNKYALKLQRARLWKKEHREKKKRT
jgi:hypothetical protein